METVIGKVIATEKMPSTIDSFYFWTNTDLVLNPFDVIKVEHIKDSVSYAVVEEISHITDSASFLSNYISSDFGDINSSSYTHRVGMNYIQAKVIGNTKNVYVPLHNDSKVCIANKKEISEALGLLNVESPVCCGYLDMYQGMDNIETVRIPVNMDSRFLIGPEGAHLNISGISGLAAKTSYAMFLLKALQDKMLQEEINDNDTAFIIFNVKGKDLLSVDQPNEFKDDKTREETFSLYKEMGLNTNPFKNVQYLYPYSDSHQWNTHADEKLIKKQQAEHKAIYYKFNYQENKDNLDIMFSSIDDPTQSIDAILNYISTNQSFKGTNSWGDFLIQIDSKSQAGGNGDKDITVASWRKFKRIVTKSIKDVRIFSSVKDEKKEVELQDKIKEIKKNDVYVIDIAKLNENMQAFVFGSAIRYIYDLQLGTEDVENAPSKIIIFIDELNKYASTDVPKSSTILRQLLDIAERGRSLGIILFGAEQFKSAIHQRVIGNCSAHAYGRTNAIEISKSEYKFIPQVYKNMMTRLKQGEYIVHNPAFRSLINIKFPLPLYKQFK